MKKIVERDPRKYIESMDRAFELNSQAVRHYFPAEKDLRQKRLMTFIHDFGAGLADSIETYEDLIEIYNNGEYGFPSVLEEAFAVLIVKRSARNIEIPFSTFHNESLIGTTRALTWLNRIWTCFHCYRKGLMLQEGSGNVQCSYDPTGRVAVAHYRCIRCGYIETNMDSAE